MTNGMKVLVDDADCEWLSKWNWKPVKSKLRIYAGRSQAQVRNGKTVNGSVLMHRQIMDAQKGKQVDHINGDALDNRRCNLRLCTQGQNNAAGRPPRKKKYSKYKGVTFYDQRGCMKWVAKAKKDGKVYYAGDTGYFDNEKEAARAYDQLARELWGEFAYQNFPAEQQAAGGAASPLGASTFGGG